MWRSCNAGRRPVAGSQQVAKLVVMWDNDEWIDPGPALGAKLMHDKPSQMRYWKEIAIGDRFILYKTRYIRTGEETAVQLGWWPIPSPGLEVGMLIAPDTKLEVPATEAA